MANNITFARPYARAIFELALAQQQLPLWRGYLQVLAQLVSDRQLALALTDPRIAPEQLLRLLGELAVQVSSDDIAPLQAQGENLLQLLLLNGRLALLPEIAEMYALLVTAHEQEIDVDITSAFALNEAQQASFSQALNQRLARKVNLSHDVDKQLIGGAIIRAGDLVIDGSIRGKLQRLAHDLVS